MLNEAKNVGDALASARLFNMSERFSKRQMSSGHLSEGTAGGWDAFNKICRLQPFDDLSNKSKDYSYIAEGLNPFSNMRFYVFLLLSLVAYTVGIAQLPSEVYWHELSEKEGFTAKNIVSFFKDSRGFVWIGSVVNGVSRFDGNEVKKFPATYRDTTSMQGRNVQGNIFEDDKSNLWITTYQAINEYRRDTDDFRSYTLNNSDGNFDSGFYCYGRIGEYIWFNHHKTVGVFSIKDKNFTILDSLPKTFNRGTVVKDGDSFYIASFRYGNNGFFLQQFNKKLQPVKKTSIPISQTNGKNNIYHILPISKKEIWLSTSKGLMLYDIEKDQFKLFDQIENQYVKNLTDIDIYDGQTLLITQKTGILRLFDRTARRYTDSIRVASTNYPSTTLDVTHIDKNKNIWTTSWGGITFYTHFNKVKFSKKLADLRFLSFIPIDDRASIAFAREGVFRLNQLNEIVDTITPFGSDMDLDNTRSPFFAFKDDKGNIISNYRRRTTAYHFSTGNFTTIKKPVLAGTSLSDGRIIFSLWFDPGLYEYVAAADTLMPITLPPSTHIHSATFISENQYGDLVISQDLEKITFLDGKTFEVKNEIPFGSAVNDIYETPGDSILWIASGDGLQSYNYCSQRLMPVNQIKETCGTAVYGITAFGHSLWLITDTGLCRYNPSSEETNNYNQSDGLPTAQSFRNGFVKMSEQELVFNSGKGLVVFNPADITSRLPLAKPKITSIIINGEQDLPLACKKTGTSNKEEIQYLELDHNQNKISLVISALEYSNPEDNKLRYRLLPDDDKWIETTNGSFCNFNNLPYKKHTFEVIAANSDGVWNDVPARLVLDIVPPIWATWYFYAFILLLVSGAVSGFVYYHSLNRQQLERIQYESRIAVEQERVRIAQDMHDDLGSQLSALGMKTVMLKHRFDHPDWKMEMEKITNTTTNISDSISETIWTVSAKNDTLEALVNQLVKYADKFFEDAAILHRFSVPSHLPTLQVRGDVRRMVLMAYKEILNNIIKHAKAKNVDIQISATPQQQITIIITDDGIGFDPEIARQKDGNGLDNLQHRMKKIDGSCTFLPVEKGTKVKLKFNLGKNK